MKLLPYFKERDFSTMLQPNLVWTVNSMEWGAIGGAKQASISAKGGRAALWDLVEYLRRPVRIYDGYLREPFDGFVSEVRVRDGALEVGVSIDGFSNRIAVTFSYIAPGTNDVGTRMTTTWVEDADSVLAYGVKEWLSSAGGMTTAGAEARRAAILAARKWPSGIPGQLEGKPRGRVRYSGAKRSLSATVYCRGWYDTLRWKYYANAAGNEGYTEYSQSQNLGDVAGNTKVAQRFSLGSNVNWEAVTVRVRVGKQGAPSDSFKVELFSDSAGAVGTTLANATLAAASVPTGTDWVELTMNVQVPIAYGSYYWVVLTRTGALSATDYYTVSVNEALGYSRGYLRLWNATAWVARATDADLTFEVRGVQETTKQIEAAIASCGQFMTGTFIDAGSGVYTNQYREGDSTALAEIEDLLKSGGANDRRLLINVELDRVVRVYEEPASTIVDYFQEADGRVYTVLGSPVEDWVPPVAQWIRLNNLIPKSADISRMIDPSLQFVEGATWSAQNGMRLRYRGQPSIEETFQLQEDGI